MTVAMPTENISPMDLELQAYEELFSAEDYYEYVSAKIEADMARARNKFDRTMDRVYKMYAHNRAREEQAYAAANLEQD